MAKRLPIWKVQDVVNIMNQCQDNQFDVIFFIEGKRGLGKSTLGWWLSRRAGSKFVPNEDLCYSRKEVIRQLAHKKRRIIFADEMINVGFKRDFYESDQKVLIKGLNMYRDSFNIFIGCIPNFQNLDSQLKDLCKLRFTVIRRGVAVVHRQVESHFMTDKWDTRNNTKIESKWSISKNSKPKYAQLTTAIAYLYFKDITAKERKLYESLKHEKRNKIYGEENDLDDDLQTKTFYQRLLDKLKSGTLAMPEFNAICEVYGLQRKNVATNLNVKLKKELDGKTFSEYIKSEKKENNKVVKKVDWKI